MLSPSAVFRPLGKKGPLVSRIGLDTAGLGFPLASDTAHISESQFLTLLDHAYKVGCTFWFTGDSYGDRRAVIRKWFSLNPEKRKDIFIASGFGVHVSGGSDLHADVISDVSASCVRSLEQLGVQSIDLFYPNRLGESMTTIEAVVTEMVKLKEQGKIKYLGLPKVPWRALRRAHAVHPITAIQVEYSAWRTEIEHPASQLLDYCRELGVAVLASSPLSRGLLAGGIQDINSCSLNKHLIPRDELIRECINQAAARKQVTSAQIALAWLLDQGYDIFPIPRAITPRHVEENFDAIHVDLTSESRHIRDLVDEASDASYPGRRSRWAVDDHSLGNWQREKGGIEQ